MKSEIVGGQEVPEGTRELLGRLNQALFGEAAGHALDIIRQFQAPHPLSDKAKLKRRLAQRMKASERVENGRTYPNAALSGPGRRK